MRSKHRSPAWPYLGILICLCVLSVTAPRAWEKTARRESLTDLLAARESRHREPVRLSGTQMQSDLEAHSFVPAIAAVEADAQSSELDGQIENSAPPDPDAVADANVINPAAESETGVELVVPDIESAILDGGESPRVDGPAETTPADTVALEPQDPEPGTLEPAAAGPASDSFVWTSDGPETIDEEPAPVLQPQEPIAAERPARDEPKPMPAAPIFVPTAPAFANEIIDPAYEICRQPGTPNSVAAARPTQIKPSKPAIAEWPVPENLLKQLDRVANHEHCAAWANETAKLVRELLDRKGSRGERSLAIVSELRRLETAANPLLEKLTSAPAGEDLLRAQYGLSRRLDVWERLASLDGPRRPKDVHSVSRQSDSLSPLASSLSDADRLMRSAAQGAGWRNYLLLDKLHRLADQGMPRDEEERRTLAREVLVRLSHPRLTHDQRQFLASGPITDLKAELRHWAAEPVEPAVLLAHLEQYERTGLGSDGKVLADDCRWMSGSSTADDSHLGSRLDDQYRNANLRITVTGKLLNRLVPQPAAKQAAVNDVIVGVPVYGRSATFTRLFVRLVPDQHRVRFGLEAIGKVASSTESSAGPVTFHHKGEASFLVRKLFVYGPKGLRDWAPVAEANSYYNGLVSLESNFDGMPLVGPVVRNMALSQHEQAQGQARREAEQKIARRAQNELEQELRPRLAQAKSNLDHRVLEPLERLGLEPSPISLSTTSDRLVMRWRLAGQEQLGAHTPRPRAPANSLLSVQVHQSALNNVLEHLELNGRKFTLPEMFQWVGKKLNRAEVVLPDDLPEDVTIQFADQDAIRVSCIDNKLEVTISVADLSQGRKHWRNFTVRTFYAPETQGLQARFIRDTTIFLDGPGFRGKPELVLRGIFSKVLSRNRPFNLIDEKQAANPQLKDLEVKQLILEDGWMALALSQRPAPDKVAKRKGEVGER